VTDMAQLKVGDTVLVPWGLQGDVAGRIVDVWGDPPQHVRVELTFKDDDEGAAPTTLLLGASVVRAA
jgi:hypothetical protein